MHFSFVYARIFIVFLILDNEEFVTQLLKSTMQSLLTCSFPQSPNNILFTISAKCTSLLYMRKFFHSFPDSRHLRICESNSYYPLCNHCWCVVSHSLQTIFSISTKFTYVLSILRFINWICYQYLNVSAYFSVEIHQLTDSLASISYYTWKYPSTYCHTISVYGWRIIIRIPTIKVML